MLHTLVFVSTAFPARQEGTNDYYPLAVWTPFTSIDSGMEPGALSKTSYTWTKARNPNPITNNLRLVIQNAQLQDGGVYQCFVEVESFSDTQNVTVLVHDHTLFSNPLSTDGYSVIPVQLGEQSNASFTCQVEAQTDKNALKSVNVTWRHKGKELTDWDKYSIVYNESNITSNGMSYQRAVSKLTIHDVHSMDSDEVTCEGKIVAIGGQEKTEQVTRLQKRTSLYVLSKLCGLHKVGMP